VTRDDLVAIVQQHAPSSSSILIVEDNLEMALLIRRQLEGMDAGYRVIQATDGIAAVRTIKERRPDLILLDLGLPHRDGHQVLHEKNLDPQLAGIPVVIVSARNPAGEPAIANRLRVELVGGLSTRDVMNCVDAISRAFAPASRLGNPASPEIAAG
jgi:CheY-like chemotaxis protein